MKVFFLGISGTLMGNLALMAKELGHDVMGVDSKIYPPMSDQLKNANIDYLEEVFKTSDLNNYLNLKNIWKLKIFKSRINATRIWKIYFLDRYLNDIKTLVN